MARLGKVAIIPPIVLEYRAHEKQWRPKNIVEVRKKVFQEFINSLPAEEQPRGKSIRASAHYSEKAEDEYRNGNYKKALNCYLKACKSAPEFVVSPITGKQLVRGVAKSLVRFLLPKKQ